MKKRLILLLLILLSALTFLSAKDPSFNQLTVSGGPGAYTYDSGVTYTGLIEFKHKYDPVDVAFGFTVGENGTGYDARRAVYSSNQDGTWYLDYNLYDSVGSGNILVDPGDSSAPSGEGYTFFTDSLPLSNSWNLYTDNFFTVSVPPEQYGLGVTYEDTVTLNFYTVSGSTYTLVASADFTVEISVGAVTQVSIVPDTVFIFDPNSPGFTLDFGSFELNESGSFNTIVLSNVPYTLSVSSLRNGQMRLISDPTDPSYIDYTLSFNSGTPSTLTTADTVLVTDGTATIVDGTFYPSEVTITNIPADNVGGDYDDILTFTVTAQ